VRYDTGIAPMKQGHLQATFATITPHRQRVVRRSSKSERHEGPIAGHIFENRSNVNDKHKSCRFTGKQLRMVLGPVNGYRQRELSTLESTGK